MIQLRRTLILAHETLAKNNIKHALIGGLALAVYNGDSRSTADIDLLAEGNKKNLIKTSLIQVGFILNYESDEVLQFKGVGFLDIILANRDLTKEMLSQAITNNSLNIKVARAEDIIGLKIQAYKNDPTREFQDKADIMNLLKVPQLNLELIKKYADLFDEWPTIKEMKDKNESN